MSLLSDIEAAEAATRKGPRCSIAIILEALSEDDAAGLRRALDAKKAKAIATGLRSNGHQVAAETIRRHQRRDCTCR